MAGFNFNADRFSKEDLAYIIKNMVDRQGSEYMFRFAEYDLALEKKADAELARLDRAEMLREAAEAKRREAAKLAEPWLKARRQLPLEVQQKYAQLIKEAKEFEKKIKRGDY